MATGRAASNWDVPGTLTCGAFAITGTTEIPAANLKHVHRMVYSQEFDATPTTEDKVLFVAVATGTIITFQVVVCAAESSGNSVSVDLCLNSKGVGETVLSAPVVMNSSNVAFTPEAGTIASASFSAADALIVTITDSSSDATGLYVLLDVVEAYD